MAADRNNHVLGPTVAMAVGAANDVLVGQRDGIRRATASTRLDELGFDSLEVAELFAALEDRCGIELDPESAQPLMTVGDLAQLRGFGRVAGISGDAA
jgi:acyl carrier protein